MGLITNMAALGVGYALGRLEGHQRVLELRGQVIELARRPQIMRLRERSWDLAGDRIVAAKRRLDARSAGGDSTDRPSLVWRRSRPSPADTAADPAAAGGLPVPPSPAGPAPAVPPTDHP